MDLNYSRYLILFLAVTVLLVSPVVGADVGGGQATVTLILDGPTAPVVSTVYITADDAVKSVGYTINGHLNCQTMEISGAVMNKIIIRFNSVPNWASPNISLTFNGQTDLLVGNPFILDIQPHSTGTRFDIHLSYGGTPPDDTPVVVPTVPSGWGGGSDISPDVPDVPEAPDTPGSSDPYSPILPPAGSVHSIVGFIPLAAGFFLLFLLFAFRGHLVYRILRKHAKQHCDEMPEKQQLKETAAAVISLIRDERAYPEWRKNSVLTERLKADIIRTLSEKQYPPTVPRDAVVAEIVKAAKGRINRHRL